MRIRNFRWKDQKIQVRFFITYLLLAILPLIILASSVYLTLQRDSERKAQEDFLVVTKQIDQSVEKYLRLIDRMTIIPFGETALYQILSKTPQNDAGSLTLQNEKELHNYFMGLQSLQEGIRAIYMMSKEDNVYGYSAGRAVYPVNKVKKEAWYQQVIEREGGLVNSGLRDESQFFSPVISDQVITFARYVTSVITGEKIGVFAIDVDPSVFTYTIEKVNKGNVVIMDQYQNILYSQQPPGSEKELMLAEGKAASDESVFFQWKKDGKRWIGVNHVSSYTGWSTTYYITSDELFSDLNRIFRFTIYVILALLLLSIVLAGVVSRSVAQPIKLLSRHMNLLRSGNFNISLPFQGKDEIGFLTHSFNSMVYELKNLLERISEEEKLKRKAETDALLAQMNPHFMYNTLSAIRMMAMMQNAQEISHALETFMQLMRYSTQSYKNKVKMKEEIQFVDNYVSLLEMRYMRPIPVKYNIAPEHEDYELLPFLIQPIMENAVFHGMNQGDSTFSIEIRTAYDEFSGQFQITIQDTGAGISPERLPTLLTRANPVLQGTQGLGTALINVNNRLKLEYGEAYGFSITSSMGEGTIVNLCFPGNKGGNDGI
ncbi:sensor histidine kinase [Paenibacillus wynnii]|uniref:HAMP domain-containing protein n=1 Tax=Paenibacillus wynnii TaxID=268407 RepID=A0A098M8C1_9BACL|nr:sensor histidine kinase [Paenibacillus wynnii]KGE18795.1 hypothetical protein PWYN_04990 [Paenibacillus wynnii]